jgi:hypothetical protein
MLIVSWFPHTCDYVVVPAAECCEEVDTPAHSNESVLGGRDEEIRWITENENAVRSHA